MNPILKSNKFLNIIIVLLLIVIAAILLSNIQILNTTIVAAIIGSLITAVFVYGQLKQAREAFEYTKRSIEAQSTLELFKAFSQNREIQTVYETLKKYEKGLILFNEVKELKTDHIASYLTFFETLNVLEKAGMIKIHTINDLFGSRFFLAVKNKYIQEEVLFKEAPTDKDIFRLHKKLVNYLSKGQTDEIEIKYSEYRDSEIKKAVEKAKTDAEKAKAKADAEKEWPKYDELSKEDNQ